MHDVSVGHYALCAKRREQIKREHYYHGSEEKEGSKEDCKEDHEEANLVFTKSRHQAGFCFRTS